MTVIAHNMYKNKYQFANKPICNILRNQGCFLYSENTITILQYTCIIMEHIKDINCIGRATWHDTKQTSVMKFSAY